MLPYFKSFWLLYLLSICEKDYQEYVIKYSFNSLILMSNIDDDEFVEGEEI